MTHARQKGITTVEFAIVCVALMAMILGIFEVSRAYYTMAILDEVTRRGARLAAVCPVNDAAISQLALMNASGDTGNSRFVPGMVPGNVVIEYLDTNNAVVANPADPAGFAQIRYVRARVQGYIYQTSIPFVAGVASLVMPDFSYTLPRESLGIPRDGVVTPC